MPNFLSVLFKLIFASLCLSTVSFPQELMKGKAHLLYEFRVKLNDNLTFLSFFLCACFFLALPLKRVSLLANYTAVRMILNECAE